MIIALVRILSDGLKRSQDKLVEQSRESTNIFHNAKGLRRKNYLNNADGVGGIYEFANQEDAKAWFNVEREDWIEGRFGVRPSLTIFDNPVILDNEQGEVRVDGKPLPAPWKE